MKEPWERGLLTENEDAALNAIGGFMRAYHRLPLGHPHEAVEVELSIHTLQRLIMMRPLLRSCPDRFTMSDEFREVYGLPPDPLAALLVGVEMRREGS